jgi:hypothetical protein
MSSEVASKLRCKTPSLKTIFNGPEKGNGFPNELRMGISLLLSVISITLIKTLAVSNLDFTILTVMSGLYAGEALRQAYIHPKNLNSHKH